MIRKTASIIVKRIKDLRISLRLMLFYLILSLMSILVSSLLYSNIYSNIIRNRMQDTSIQTLTSVDSSIETLIHNADNLSKVIVTSEEIQSALNTDPQDEAPRSGSESATFQQETNPHRLITSYVSRFMDTFPFLSSIYIFDEASNRFGADTIVMKSPVYDDIRDVPWYEEVQQAQGGHIIRLDSGGFFGSLEDEQYVSIIRSINDLSTQRQIGVMILNIDGKALLDSFAGLYDDFLFDVAVLNEDGNFIFDFRGLSPDLSRQVLERVPLQSTAAGIHQLDDVDYLISNVDSSHQDWTLVGVTPYDALSDDTYIFSTIAFAVIGINSLLLFLGSIFVSRMITTPIRRLLRSMKKIESGQLEPVTINAGNNEIGMLQEGYNKLIHEVEMLLSRLEEGHQSQRQAELNALQAQIKPHFLYNTFDAISSLALAGQNDEVYQIMKALGSYYRISLSRGAEVISLKEEIQVIENYLTIQNIRYDDAFTVSYDIDPSVLDQKIPKLILQPLVENAIYHGIKPKGEPGHIEIIIQALQDVIEIVIRDDGIGMKEDPKTLLRSDRLGQDSFGLLGTVRRLQLFYQVEDVVRIDSEYGQGTTITLCIPRRSDS